MSLPIDDPDDPCYLAARASSAECCAYWCARAIAQWASRNIEGAQRENAYNHVVSVAQPRLLDSIRRIEELALSLKESGK